jgi:hypothetical protein
VVGVAVVEAGVVATLRLSAALVDGRACLSGL